MGRRERMVRIVGAVLAMGCTLLAGLPLQAQTVLFGPTQYTRTAGPPNQFTDTVTLPAGTTAPYTLHVVNGNANGTNRISSATVKLNGIQILGPSDFGQNVAVLDRTVALQASNTLEIRLTSAPGSFIVVSVLDTGVGAQPTALTPNPLNLTVGATAGLTATLAPAPTAAGSVTVTSSNATVATVPASVTFTAGQTNLLIPVTGIASGSTTVTVSLNGVSVASQVDVALPAPTVTGFTPTSGQPGTSVTVTGTNFVNVQTVTFHGVLAPTFTVTNATTLVAVVPPTATTGPIAIMTPAGAGTSAASFTAIPAPTVASLQPATRSIVRGTTGTVTVTLSAAQTTATSVALSSSNTTVATVPGTVTVPANQLSAPVAVTALVQGQADITASLNGANATSTITVVNPVPSLATLSPASLPSGSPTQTLTVTGQSFVSGATVHFGATALVTTFVSATQLTATIPAAQLTTKGTVPVTVENPAPGGGASNSLPFTIINGAPVLAPIGNKTIPLGSTLTFTATATDPDNDPISFAVTPLPLPAHAIFHSQTGLFLFTPDATQVGTVPLTFSVHDGILTTSEAITITVTGAPPGGVTSLTGRVDDTSQHPLDNLAVSLKGTTLTTTTAADGTFTLTSATLPTGRQQLVVTGLPQNFANLVVPVDIIPSVSNQLPQPLTLPPIDMATAVTVNPAAMTILTSPTLNVTVTIPPHTAKNPDGTDYTGPLTISPVPEYGRPESRPIELKPGLSVTIQPAGLLMDPPAPITFPNQDNLPPNTEFHLWSLSPDTGAFNAVGLLKVSADGLRLETVSGGVRQTAWHFPLAAAPRGAAGAEERGPCTECGMASTGDLREGNLIQRVVVPGVRTLGVSRDLTFHYQSTSADARPILPMNMLQSARASIPNTFSGRAVLGGVQQGPDRYWNATTLTPGVDNTFRIGLQLDSADLPTGLYPYELMVFSNYTQSSIGGGARGFTLLRNEQANPFGAGWTLEGLDRLYPQSDGRLLLAEGAGGTKLFGQSGRPIVIESFNVARSATISGVTTSFVGGPMFSEAKTDLLTPANFGATGTVSRPVTFRTGLQTLTAAALTGVDIFVLNQPATILSASEVQALEQFVAEGGAVFELSNLGATRPVLFGTFAGSNLVDPTADFTLAGLTSPLATGAFGTVTASLVTGPNSAYAVAGLATVIATNNSGPNVLLLAPDAGFSGLGRAVLIGDDEVFATGHPNVNNYTVGSNKAVFLNTIAFLAQSPGFGIPAPAAGQTAAYRGPANDFSTISKNAAGTYTRRLKDGTTYQFTAQGLQSARADRNGNTTAYVYNGSNQLMTITDPAGQVTTLNYNGTHLAIITDPAGRVTTVIHNGTGQLTGVTYADSSHLSFAYDPQHRMTQRTDARGQVSQYQYDHTGRFTQAILPTGQTRRLTPSEQSAVPNLAAGQGTVSNPATLSLGTVNRASFTDAKHQTTTFETDAFGGVTKQIDALTRTMTITRNAQGQPTTITRPNGAVTTMTYDSRGNLFLSTEQAIAATTGFLYDPLFNQVTLLVDPKNNQTALTYDAHGNPLTITDADNKVTIFTYDSRGLLLTSNDALNQTTTFTYDTQGRLLTTTDPLTRTTTLTYDAAGNVATSTDALNRVTTFQYDQKNRLKQVTDPATGVTQYTYDGNGNLLTVKDAKNQTTTFTYDDQNRLTSTTDPLGKVESYTYDGNDNLLTRVTPKADTISFAYNAANELITKTLPGILLTQYGYDTGGNLTSVTDPDSALAMTYDQANRLLTTSTTGSSNQPSVTLTYTYDKNGNRVERLDPVSRVGYGADKLNRLTFGTTPPGAGPFPANLLAAYPADGTANDPINNQHGTLQGGTTFTSGLVSQAFAFDGLDDFVTVPDSLLLDTLTTAATVEAWIKPELLPPPHATYDLFARRTEGGPTGFVVLLTDGGRVGFTVETTGSGPSLFFTAPLQLQFGQWQHVAVTVEPGTNLKKAYVNGQEVPVTAFSGSATLSGTLLPANNLYIGRRGVYPVGDNQHYKGLVEDLRLYDRALTATEILALADRLRARYAYDALSRRTSLTLPNGTSTSYTYDPASQVTNILHQIVSSATQINQAAYAYNPVGNRTSLTDRRGSQVFGYDTLDRLTSASHPLLATPQAFAYDPVGNRTTGGTVVNAGNQLTADATHSYQYDDNGNLTRKTLLATGNFTQYTYDAENRLTKAEDFVAGNPTPTATSTYRYDGLGRRIEKVANGQTTRYIYDGEDILLEYDGANVLQARYTHGPGIDEPIAVTKAGSTFYYHQDGLGTVTELTDSNGSIAKAYAYDAYGNILESPGTVEQPYTYTGREFDSETGLYYYRARYYDAQIGKFTQRDPIGRVGGNNYYEYALGNPALHFDPFGLKAQIVIWAAVGIGTSSFGHVSTNINGTTYSFGPNGMTNEPTSVFNQRNSFRSSLGLELNLTAEQEEALEECLKRDQPDYNFLTNNCGAPVQRCLNWMGYDIGKVLTPSQLYESMTGVGLVGGTIFYPGAATKPAQAK